jgi:hypothetical protein
MIHLPRLRAQKKQCRRRHGDDNAALSTVVLRRVLKTSMLPRQIFPADGSVSSPTKGTTQQATARTTPLFRRHSFSLPAPNYRAGRAAALTTTRSRARPSMPCNILYALQYLIPASFCKPKHAPTQIVPLTTAAAGYHRVPLRKAH